MSLFNFKNKKEKNKIDQNILSSNPDLNDLGYEIKSDADISEIEETNLSYHIKEETNSETFLEKNNMSYNEDEDLIPSFNLEDSVVGDDCKKSKKEESNVEKEEDLQKNAMDFLDHFSVGDQEEILLDPSSIRDLKEDIILGSVKKKNYVKIYLLIGFAFLGAISAFFLSFFISQYNLVFEPTVNAKYIINNQYSIVEKYPRVSSVDMKEKDIILFKKDPQNRFIDNYSRGIVVEISKRTVRVYDEKSKAIKEIGYENIWYVVDSSKLKNTDNINVEN